MHGTDVGDEGLVDVAGDGKDVAVVLEPAAQSAADFALFGQYFFLFCSLEELLGSDDDVAEGSSEPVPGGLDVREQCVPDQSRVVGVRVEETDGEIFHSVHASVRREGEWYSLSYSHQLGHGARRMAFAALSPTVETFRDLCTYEADRHSHAAELATQAATLLSLSYDDMLRKVDIVGSTIFKDQLQFAQDLWLQATDLWGRGGYRDGVASQLQEWFTDDDRRTVEAELLAVLAREWAAVCERVGDILDVE